MPHEPKTASGKRRVAAIWLPDVLLEARGEKRRSKPFAVVLLPESTEGTKQRNGTEKREPADRSLESSDRLSAVCPRTQRLGVAPGQTIVEASALVAGLRVEAVTRAELKELLLAIAEAVRDLGITVSFDEVSCDTVWLDVTGVAPLFGGEESLAFEIRERVRLLGHLNRVAVAAGPRIAQAVARHGPPAQSGIQVVTRDETPSVMRNLPLCALPLERELLAWFTQLGVLTVEDLLQLPARSVSARLGPRARKVLELARGHDDFPLVPCVFARHLEQKMEWEEPSEGISPLLFALRGLTGKISARLQGRGESVTRLELDLIHDAGIARHRGIAARLSLEFELSSPLRSQSDLERVVRSRLERTQLQAPVVGMVLYASGLTGQVMHQLEFGQGNALDSTELPVLLAELQAEMGKERVGLLQAVDHHRPEAKSILISVPSQESATDKRSRRRVASRSGSGSRRDRAWYRRTPLDRVTRFLPRPLPISSPLQVGAGLVLGDVFYTIETLRFVQRLESVEWWTPRSTHRDYLWAWLQGARGGTEALLFVDKRTGHRFVQALVE